MRLRQRLLLAAIALPLLAGGDVVRARGAQWPPDVEIVALDLAGHRTNLTQNGALDISPAVSRDGRIAFVSTRDGRADVYVMDGSGRGVRRVTASPFDDSMVAWGEAGASAISWSPDGRRIAFDAQNATYPPWCLRNCVDWRVYVANADGSGLRLLSGEAEAPAWSPGGRRIAYNSDVDPYQVAHGLTVVGASGTGAVDVAVDDPVADVSPAWSPSGRELAFQTLVGNNFPLRIGVVRADGRKKRLLTTGRDPSWSPDGRQIAFIANYRLLTIDRDGTARRRISRNGELVLAAAWAPKRQTIAVVAASSLEPGGGAPRGLRVETTSADGRRVRVLAREPAGTRLWSGPVWTPDGSRILVAVG